MPGRRSTRWTTPGPNTSSTRPFPTLYRSRYPNYTLTPWLASDVEPPAGSADGDNWVIDVNMREGLVLVRRITAHGR